MHQEQALPLKKLLSIQFLCTIELSYCIGYVSVESRSRCGRLPSAHLGQSGIKNAHIHCLRFRNLIKRTSSQPHSGRHALDKNRYELAVMRLGLVLLIPNLQTFEASNALQEGAQTACDLPRILRVLSSVRARCLPQRKHDMLAVPLND